MKYYYKNAVSEKVYCDCLSAAMIGAKKLVADSKLNTYVYRASNDEQIAMFLPGGRVYTY